MSLKIVLTRAIFRPNVSGVFCFSTSICGVRPAQSRPVLKTLLETVQLTSKRAASTQPPTPPKGGTIAAKPKPPTTPSSPEPRKYLYPENLVIYHAGTARTTFLACLKLSTIFVFLFFNVIVVPNYIAAGQPPLTTAGLALCGVVPITLVALITSPFVASVSIRLPIFARQSRDLLERWAKKGVPPETELFITTLSFIGKPRVSRMGVRELEPKRERLGLVNYVRRGEGLKREKERRKWWMFRAVGQFNITPGGQERVKGGFVWPEVEKAIRQNATGTGKV